jgi:hypothetical protein
MERTTNATEHGPAERPAGRRLLRRKTIVGAAGAVAALAASASIALGQVAPAPDGGPQPVHPPDPPKVTTCNGTVGSTVITQEDPTRTSQTQFGVLPGATRHLVVNGPRCIKVLFTAETACGLSGGPDFCYVQARINGVPMDPNGEGFQAIDSEDGTASAHAYEWVKRVPAGAYTVDIRWRTLAATTVFWADDWTMDIEQTL